VTGVRTPDGRELELFEGGAPGGVPIVVHNGTPGSGMLYEPHVRDAEEKGIRLVGYSRPGYGGSTPQPGRTVADAARDVETICDALGLGRIATWGISGGGPHALACAALLPERVAAVAALASVAPYGADGLDWFEGMGEGNIAEFGAALKGREALVPALEAEAAGLAEAGREGLVEAMAPFVTPTDAEVLRGPYGGYLFEEAMHALGERRDGWIDDDLAFAAPWGFDPADVRVPALVWQGDRDVMVPPGHGRWLAARIPGVEARLTEEDSHLTLVERRIPDVHAWLLDRLGG